MNVITIAEIKRRGMSAVEEALAHGPVHLMKRNRPAAVLLSEEAYERLRAAAETSGKVHGSAALEWFLSEQPAGTLDEQGLEDRVAEVRADWCER
jgi:prevent-host-death family protein